MAGNFLTIFEYRLLCLNCCFSYFSGGTEEVWLRTRSIIPRLSLFILWLYFLLLKYPLKCFWSFEVSGLKSGLESVSISLTKRRWFYRYIWELSLSLTYCLLICNFWRYFFCCSSYSLIARGEFYLIFFIFSRWSWNARSYIYMSASFDLRWGLNILQYNYCNIARKHRELFILWLLE